MSNSLLPANNDNQTAQQTNVAVQYPNTIDTLSHMQFPDMPGGPDSNAPISPRQQVHYPTVRTPPTPQSLGMPAYGTSLNSGSSYQASPAE